MDVTSVVFYADFCDFLRNGLHVAERKFKNVVLATYHEELLAGLTQASGSFNVETESTRRRLKAIRDRLRDKLKASHGHPDNTWKLEALLDEFRSVCSECEDSLRDVCARAEVRFDYVILHFFEHSIFFIYFHAHVNRFIVFRFPLPEYRSVSRNSLNTTRPGVPKTSWEQPPCPWSAIPVSGSRWVA